MADGTRLKDLQDGQKKLETELMKREAAEKRLQEQITNVTVEVNKNVDSKFEYLTNAIASTQLQLNSLGKGKVTCEDESILGEPPSQYKLEGESYMSYTQNKSKAIVDPRSYKRTHSPPKVEFPKFDGNTPRAWILRCNSYFKLQNTAEDEKVTLASMYFEGRAALWYQSFSADHQDVSWTQFVEVLSARFEELQGDRIVDDFNKLRLAGNYMDFVEKFEELKDCMKILYGDAFSEAYYVSSFLSGLTPELKSAVKMMKPKTLQQAIDLGRDQLETIEAITRKIRGSTRPNPG